MLSSISVGWRPFARLCGIFVLAFYVGCFYETLQLECSFRHTSFLSSDSATPITDSSLPNNLPFPYSIHKIQQNDEKDQLFQTLRIQQLTGRSSQELTSSSNNPLLIVPSSHNSSRTNRDGAGDDVKSLLKDCATIRLWMANEEQYTDDSCLALVAQPTYETNQVFGAHTIEHSNVDQYIEQQRFRPRLFPQFVQSFAQIQSELISVVALLSLGKHESLRMVMILLDEKKDENSLKHQTELLQNWLCAASQQQSIPTLIVCMSTDKNCQKVHSLAQLFSHNNRLRVWQPTSLLLQNEFSTTLQQTTLFYVVLQAGYNFMSMDYQTTIPTNGLPISQIEGDMEISVSFGNPNTEDDNTSPPEVFAPWTVRGDWMHVKSNLRTKHVFHRWLVRQLLFDSEKEEALSKRNGLAEFSTMLWEEASLFGLRLEVVKEPAGAVSIWNATLARATSSQSGKETWLAAGHWYLEDESSGRCRNFN